MINDPKTLGLAFLGGIIPSLIWLWFWLKQEEKKPEPPGILMLVFIVSMISVLIVIPIQKFIQTQISSENWQLVIWAGAEEIIKYLAVLVVLYKSRYIDEPLDWPIYMITAAVGFAALENMLFLIEPVSHAILTGEATVSLLTGQLRFLGATLLHTVCSAIIGIAIGLSYFMHKRAKRIYLFFGIIVAIALHSVFNFFIIENNGDDFLEVFAFLWVITIIVMLLFEKVRRMS